MVTDAPQPPVWRMDDTGTGIRRSNHAVGPAIAQLVPSFRKLMAKNCPAPEAYEGETVATDAYRSITLPVGWEVSSKPRLIGYVYKCVNQRAVDTTIGLYERGTNLSRRDEGALKTVFNHCANQKLPRLIYDCAWEKSFAYRNDELRRMRVEQQMKDLSGVFGSTRMGDNQFTISNRALNLATRFHIEKVEVQNLNGFPVIFVEGYTCNVNDGSLECYLAGIFIAKEDQRGMHVHEVFLQSSDKMNFIANKSVFKKVVASIQW